MKETVSGQTPTADDLSEWASNAGADHPVLADPGGDVAIRFIREDPAAINGNTISISYPNTQMLAPGMVVEWINVNFPSESDITSVLPE